MPRQKGESDRVSDRRVKVARLYCTGWPMHKIASEVGVSRQMIFKDMQAVRSEWQRSMVADFDRLKSEQLGKIDAVEDEAYRGWRRSLKDAERTKNKETKDGDFTETVKEGQAGDPRFLQVVLGCVERRCKLIGADAPQKMKHSGAINLTGLSDEQLGNLEALARRAYAIAQSGRDTVREGPPPIQTNGVHNP